MATTEAEIEARVALLVGATVVSATYHDTHGNRCLSIMLSNGAHIEMSYASGAYGSGEQLTAEAYLDGPPVNGKLFYETVSGDDGVL